MGGQFAARDGAGRAPGLFERAGHAFEPVQPGVAGQRAARGIAYGVDAAHGGTAFAIHGNAVGAVQAEGLRQFHAGRRAHADEHGIALQSGAIGHPQGRDAGGAVSLDGGDRCIEMHLHALACMQLQQMRSHLRRGAARQQPAFALDDPDLHAQLAGRGSDFEARIAAADDGQAACGLQMAPQRLRVFHGAQVGDARPLIPGQDQPARRGACGNDQVFVVQHRSVVQRHLPRARLYGHGAHARAQGDGLVRGGAGGPRQQLVRAHGLLQPCPGQRRAQVGRQVLAADHSDRTRVAVLAQQGGQGATGVSGADDDGMALGVLCGVHAAPSQEARSTGRAQISSQACRMKRAAATFCSSRS